MTFFTFIKPVTQRDVIKHNLENDLAFRIGMGKTILVNLNNTKNNFQEDKKLKAVSNLALATLASIATITYPANGNWDVYTKYFGVSKNKVMALKLISLISGANACVNTFRTPAIDKWYLLEAGINVSTCGIPACKIAWSFRN